MRPEWEGAAPRGVRRLHGYRGTLERWVDELPASAGGGGSSDLLRPRHLVILCVHSHHRFIGPASLDAVRAAFGRPPTCLVALPCCARFRPDRDVGRRPDVVYDDACIFSACR